VNVYSHQPGPCIARPPYEGAGPGVVKQSFLGALGILLSVIPIGDILDAAAISGTAAEDGLNVEGANFAQRTFSSTFRGGSLAGRSISDVAGDLGSGR
jgi:hypothetical protein